MAQFPGKPILYRMNLGALIPSTDYTLTINETGKIGDATTCDEVGSEFNPLTETDKFGNKNPYQDPTRGTINGGVATADENGNIIFEASTDNIILQNLSGKDGLLGRSVTLAEAVSENLVTCCVIALEATPEQF